MHRGDLAARGHDWFVGDPSNVPGLAAESLIIKIGENVARVSPETRGARPDVPWSLIKRMRDRLPHHHEATDYRLVWDTLVVDLSASRAYARSVLDR